MRPLCALLCLLCLPACSIQDMTLRRLGRAGTQGAVQGLSDSREAVRAALRDLLLQDDLLPQIAERFTRGAVASLTEAEQRARVQALAQALGDALQERGNEIMRSYLRTAGGELERTLARVAADSLAKVDAAVKNLISQELTESTQRLIRRNAEALAQVLATELEGALGRTLQETSGQVARTMVREAVQELRSPESQAALREFLREASRDAVGGMHAGLRAEWSGSQPQMALIAGLITMGAFLLLAGAALWFFVRQYLQSTKALALIAQKINEAGEAQGGLKAAIRDSAQRSDVDRWLNGFLKRRGL